MSRWTIAMAALAALAIGIGGLMFGLFPKRPDRLSLDVTPHPSVVVVMHMRINDAQMLDSTLKGRNQTGGAPYRSRFGANLATEVMWYDVVDEIFYHAAFDVDARQLSTFGTKGDHAVLNVEIGPGAAVLADTPSPEALRLVGLNQMDDITPEMDVPVILVDTCAVQVPADPSPDGIMMRALASEDAVARALAARETWLAGRAPETTCDDQEGQQ